MLRHANLPNQSRPYMARIRLRSYSPLSAEEPVIIEALCPPLIIVIAAIFLDQAKERQEFPNIVLAVFCQVRLFP